MKDPIICFHLSSFTTALSVLGKARKLTCLRALKEALISEQHFEQACVVRDVEKSFSGGKSDINHRKKARSRAKN